MIFSVVVVDFVILTFPEGAEVKPQVRRFLQTRRVAGQNAVEEQRLDGGKVRIAVRELEQNGDIVGKLRLTAFELKNPRIGFPYLTDPRFIGFRGRGRDRPEFFQLFQQFPEPDGHLFPQGEFRVKRLRLPTDAPPA